MEQQREHRVGTDVTLAPDQADSSVSPTPVGELITVQTVSLRLKMSERHVRTLLRDGRLKGIRFPGSGSARVNWRVDPLDLKAWIDLHRV